MKIVIVGAGPVGALAALYAAKRDHEVEVYEFRDDLSIAAVIPLNFTKSINLTLSERGLTGLSHAGDAQLLDDVIRSTVPVSARMVHGKSRRGDLTCKELQYDVHGGVLSVVDRGRLNERLLLELSKYKNIKVFFNHKLTSANLDECFAVFRKCDEEDTQCREKLAKQEVTVHFDLIIGADGAHSATRQQLERHARLDFSQAWLDIFWSEFKISTTKAGVPKLDLEHLHIWPQRDFMFIALPDLEGTFTCNLFAPEKIFQGLERSPETLVPFFLKNFPGVVPQLIDPQTLTQQFQHNQHQPLVTFRCNRFHYSDSCVIVGDAAHVMVPFYGQGLNTGFEDVRILFEDFIDKISLKKRSHYCLAPALAAYSETRETDVHIITDLALKNYEEMRTGVTSHSYLIRKWIEEFLSLWAPSLGWSTLYHNVAFANMSYREVKRKFEYQKMVLQSLSVSLIALGLVLLLYIIKVLAPWLGIESLSYK